MFFNSLIPYNPSFISFLVQMYLKYKKKQITVLLHLGNNKFHILKESDSERPILSPASVMGDQTTVLLSFRQEQDFECVENTNGDTRKNDVITDHIHDDSKVAVHNTDGAD